MRGVLAVVLWVGAASALQAAEPTFTRKPAAVQREGATVVTFAVSKEMDVAVAIVAKDGNVVRHLAAGMLGTNAPAPLKKASMKPSKTLLVSSPPCSVCRGTN